MPKKTRIVKPGKSRREVFAEDGTLLRVPKSWALLKPGDAGATRRVKAAGPSWTVKAKRGRRIVSLGVWADAKTIASINQNLAAERSTESYAKRQQAAKKRRDRIQESYIEQFTESVFRFLNFDTKYETLAKKLAQAIAVHATPVGSGTVARTKTIPVERRAEAAVIAWLRHQTTAYDEMTIPRAKGKRREVRRMLAKRSRLLLDVYRSGKTVAAKNCLLRKALSPKPLSTSS
jgi:hypothetical protein